MPDSSRNRQHTTSFTPPGQNKNRFSPLQDLDEETEQDDTSTDYTTQVVQVSPKLPPIYVCSTTNYETFHDSLSNQTLEDFLITYTKNSLKLNLTLINDYRKIIVSTNLK